MSVPTAQLRELDLTGGMPPHTRSMSGGSTSTDVRERAIIVRDILSSFEEDLPSEYLTRVFEDIIKSPNKSTDPSYHVTPGELHISEFKVGAYNLQFFAALRLLQNEDTLSKIYSDKLSQKFETLFHNYDGLPPIPATADLPIRAGLKDIVADLKRYDEDAENDRIQRLARVPHDIRLRQDIDQRVAKVLIGQLRSLCNRGSVRVAQRRAGSTRTTPASQPSYLFQAMLGNASDQTGYFGLGFLQACSPRNLEGLQVLQDGLPGLRRLKVLLAENGASAAYQRKFATLVTEEEAEEEQPQ